MHCRRSAFLMFFMAAGGLLSGGCAASAPVSALIERDGHTLLKAGVFHGVGENKATLWRSLGDGSFEAVGPLPADAAESAQMPLTGSLRVVVFMSPRAHDGLQFAVPIDTLRLVRVPGKAYRWQIPADELERIGRAAGMLPWV